MKKVICVAALLAILTAGCGFAASTGSGFRLTQAALSDAVAAVATVAPEATQTASPTDLPTLTPLPVLTATLTPQMFPMVTFLQNTNCRKGPGLGFYSVVAYTKGAAAEVNGRNQDGSWLWLRMDTNRDYCWVATATVAAFGDVNILSVTPYQDLPAAPTSFNVTRKVCGSSNVIWLGWSHIPGAQGYRLYRAGALIETFPPSVTMTIDFVKNAKAFQYALEAFNEYGVSPRVGLSEPGC